MALDTPHPAPLDLFNSIYGSYGHRMVRISSRQSTAHLTSELLDAPSWSF
jgi:hypothetical protein